MKVYVDQAYFMDYSNSIEVIMCELGTQNNTNADWKTASIQLEDLNHFIRTRYPGEFVIDMPTHEGEHKQFVVKYVHNAMDNLEKYCKEYIESNKNFIYLTAPNQDSNLNLF
jgi:predicted YcjX-like family ATPase